MTGQSSPVRLTVGQLVPDFSLPSLDRRQVRLTDYRGHKVIVFMWASW